MQIVHLVYHSGSGSGSVSAETLLQRSVSDSVSAERGFKKYGLVSVSAEIRKSVSVGLKLTFNIISSFINVHHA